MSLREKIIAESKHLFNEKGLDHVSIRDICQHMGISPGNFTYYFPKKEDLVFSVFQEIMEEIGLRFGPGPYEMSSLDRIFGRIIGLQQEYFFVFKDIYGLVKGYPFMHPIISEVVVYRIAEINEQITRWMDEGLLKMRPELHDRQVMIGQSLWLIIAAWPSQEQLLRNTPFPIKTGEIKGMFWSVFFPFFTDKGWHLYESISAGTTWPSKAEIEK